MEAPNPRDVVELANAIVRAEDQLATLRLQWDAMFKPVNIPVEQRKVTGRPSRENSVSSHVLALINSTPGKRWDIDALAKELGAERDTISSSLYNLSVAKKLARPARGIYTSLTPESNTEEHSESEAA